MHSSTVQRDAGLELDARVHEYKDKNQVDYRTAYYAVLKRDKNLLHRYRRGDDSLVRSYADSLPPAKRVMAELQADPERARKLASSVVDHMARQRLVNTSQVVRDSRAALLQAITNVRNENPSLARCELDGFIAGDDWQLLGLLIPSVAGEIEKGHYSRSDSPRCPECGENRALCRARKLAKQRHIREDAVASFAQCIRDAQRYGNQLRM